MSAQADLLAAYANWRTWTEAEGEAIQSADWRRVAECQSAKYQLKPQINRLNLAAQREWPLDCAERTCYERAVRSVIGELIQLETKNGETLAGQHQAALARKQEINCSQSNLQRIKNSYSKMPSTAWTSFS